MLKIEKTVSVVLLILNIAGIAFSIYALTIGYSINDSLIIIYCYVSSAITVALTAYNIYCLAIGYDAHKVIRTIVEVVCGLFLVYPIYRVAEITYYNDHIDRVEIISQEFVDGGYEYINDSKIYYLQFKVEFIVHKYSAFCICYHSMFYNKNTNEELGVIPFKISDYTVGFDADVKHLYDLRVNFRIHELYDENSPYQRLFYHGSDYYSLNTIKYIQYKDAIHIGFYTDWTID